MSKRKAGIIGLGNRGMSLLEHVILALSDYCDVTAVCDVYEDRMMDAKKRAYIIGKRIMVFLAVTIFVLLMLFAPQIATLLLGDLSGGNTIEQVALAIRCVSFAILIVPFLSVTKGYLQGHKVINISSYIGHIQDGFYWEDENNEIKSALTEDLSEISEDGLTHPIKMREDVQWENRDLNTADDFVIAVWTLSF